tara:strand:+ start:892 stop:1617 length:726 start_codon:yes stop_codon:yes gene_type:complete
MESCPKCGAVIDRKRLSDPVVVCQECGTVVNDAEKVEEKKQYWNFFWSLASICAAILVLFFYMRHWQGEAASVFPLQLKSLVGLAEVDDFEKLQSVCEDQQKVDCISKLTQEIQLKQPGHLLSLERLGHIKYLTKNYDDAVESYRTYFVHGGRDSSALYEYAISLEKIDDPEKARSIYEIALRQKPDVLQITVYEKYIKLLIKTGDVKKAIETIKYVQSKATRSVDFMDGELKRLEASVGN